MKRIIMMLTVATMMVVALSITAPLAFAVSPSQEACEDQADADTTAKFDRDRGQVSCTTTEPVEGKNPKFDATTTTTTTGQGNDSNKPAKQDPTTKCNDSNPGSSCPGGQF
jgi:hypothetical protein